MDFDHNLSDPFEVLRTCVAQGLPAVAESDSGHDRLNLTSELIGLAARHRVQGLLWSAIENETVTGSEALVDLARQATVDALRTCLLSEQTTALALAALGRACIEARVLKGVAIAHLDHDNPAERVFGDADLLIRRGDYHQALSVLAGAGFRRSKPPVRTRWEQRFAKAVVLHAPIWWATRPAPHDRRRVLRRDDRSRSALGNVERPVRSWRGRGSRARP